MSNTDENTEIIHAAYPHLTVEEIASETSSQESIKEAEQLVKKNIYSHKTAKLFFNKDVLKALNSGRHYQTNIDPSRINPFYQDPAHAPHCFPLDIIVGQNDFKSANLVITLLPQSRKNKIKLEEIISVDKLRLTLRRLLFQKQKQQLSQSSYNRKIHYLDCFLANLGEKFGVLNLMRTLVQNPTKQKVNPESAFIFRKQDGPQTILDVCCTKQLYQTAIKFITEVQKSAGIDGVIDLLYGKETKKSLEQKNNPIRNHLESILPTPAFIQHVLHQKVSLQQKMLWEKDFKR